MLQLDNAIAQSHQDLMDHFDAVVINAANQCFSSPGLAIGTGSTAAVKIVNTVTYSNSTTAAPGVGVAKSKTTAEVAFTATAMDIPADPVNIQEQCYLISLDSAGTPTMTAGGIVSGAGKAPIPQRPALGANGTSYATPIGYVRIAVNVGTAGPTTNFVAGTTALSDARMTVTYYSFLGYVGRLFSKAQ